MSMIKIDRYFLLAWIALFSVGTSASAGPQYSEKVYREKDTVVTVTTYPANKTVLGKTPRTVSIRNSDSEVIEFDINGDGVALYREFRRFPYDVVFSEPSSQGYQKMTVDKRMVKGKKRGILHAEFVLSRDGRKYKLYVKSFSPFRKYADNSPGSGCFTPNSTVPNVNGGVPDQVLDVIKCDAELDDSCRKGSFASDVPAMRKGIEDVMQSALGPQQKGLSCMVQHNLGLYAGKIQHEFDNTKPQSFAMKPVSQLAAEGSCLGPDSPGPLITCDTPYVTNQLGEYDDCTGKITFNGISPDLLGQVSYDQVFFHESLHKAGIKDEPTVLRIVACCMNADSAACKQMDDQIKSQADSESHLQAYSKDLKGFSELSALINEAAGKEQTNALFDNYFADLDKTKAAIKSQYEQCSNPTHIDPPPPVNEACIQKLNLSQVLKDQISIFTTKNCKSFVGDVTDYQGNSVCLDFYTDLSKVMLGSLSQSCAPAGTPDKGVLTSCLFAASKDAAAIKKLVLNTATPGTTLMAQTPPKFNFDSTVLGSDISPADAKAVNNFIGAISKNIGPSIISEFENYVESTNNSFVVTTFSKIIQGIADRQKAAGPQGSLASQLKACEAKNPKKTEDCGPAAEAFIEAAAADNINKSCGSHINTDGSNGSTQKFRDTCAEMQSQMLRMIHNSIVSDPATKSGCQMDPPQDHRELKVPGYNFTCLVSSMALFKTCQSNPKSIECTRLQVGKVGQQKDLNLGNVQLFSLGEPKFLQGTTAQEASTGPTDATAIHDPSGYTSIHFDPIQVADGQLGSQGAPLGDQAAAVVAASNSAGTVGRYVNTYVDRAMNSIGIPDAQAAQVAATSPQAPVNPTAPDLPGTSGTPGSTGSGETIANSASSEDNPAQRVTDRSETDRTTNSSDAAPDDPPNPAYMGSVGGNFASSQIPQSSAPRASVPIRAPQATLDYSSSAGAAMPQGGSASTLAANSLNSRSAQNWQSPSQTGSQPTTQSAGAKSAGGPQFSGQIGAQGSVAGGGGLGSAGGSSTGSDTSTPQASFSGGRIVGQSQGVQSQTAGASSIRKSSANRKLASASDANSYTRSVLSLLRDDPDSALNSLHSGKLDESLNKGMVRVFDDSNQPHGPKGALCIEQWNPNNKSFKLMTPDNPQCSP